MAAPPEDFDAVMRASMLSLRRLGYEAVLCVVGIVPGVKSGSSFYSTLEPGEPGFQEAVDKLVTHAKKERGN